MKLDSIMWENQALTELHKEVWYLSFLITSSCHSRTKGLDTRDLTLEQSIEPIGDSIY